MKVYVSSTMIDLNEHRAAVSQVLRKLGHDVLGMETHVAEAARPVDVCKKDAATADVVVLLLGWRYGHVPTEDNPDRQSITEMEYRAAMAADPKKIVPLLAGPGAPWPPEYIDALSEDDDGADIARFRREVVGAHTVAVFGSPAECAQETAAAVSRAKLTDQMVKRALRSADQSGTTAFRAGVSSAIRARSRSYLSSHVQVSSR